MIHENDYDAYILKCKLAGCTPEVIAKRLGITVEEVQSRWHRIQEMAATSVATGSIQLAQQFTLMCQQYQLVGESLKIVGGALSNEASIDELKSLLESCSDAEEAAKILKKNYIVLRPFVLKDPVQSFQEHQRKMSEGN